MNPVPTSGTELCAFDALADGQGLAISWGTGKHRFGVLLLRSGDAVDAYFNRCPHFSIPLDYGGRVTTFDGRYLLCSHHYAAFRFSDGYCVEGPCQEAALKRIPVEITAGHIYLAHSFSPLAYLDPSKDTS